MNTIVIHHSADFDGLFCREIARKHFGDDAEYIGWDYGQPVPFIPTGAELYMLDISIDELMDYPKIIWIDHHKTAIEKYGHKPGIQIDGVAACRLAWQYFFSVDDHICRELGISYLPKEYYIEYRITEPLSVRLAGQYDVWDKRDGREDVFQHGLRCQTLNQDFWESILNLRNSGEDAVYHICETGKLIEKYQADRDESIILKLGFDIKFEGLNCLALNTPRCNSLSFAAGIKSHHDALLAFYLDGEKWTISLYGVPGKPNIDLSVIASKYGGGGHKQACGFQVKVLPFISVK